MTVRHIEVLLFLLAFPCLLVAQQPVAGAITGLVLDADTGHPVSKTHLTLVPRGTQEAQTMSARSDASGRFQFEALVPGQYAIMAMRTGYIRQDSLDQNLVTIRDGHVEGVVIQIRRGAVIAGRVVDEGGEPVAQITVMATEARYTGGGPQRTSYRSAITNDLGRYRLFGLMPGDYYVIVRQNSDRSETLTPDYGPAYYPVADDGSNAPPLRLRAGEQHLAADICLTLRRGARVSGRIIDSLTGQPVSWASVSIAPSTAPVSPLTANSRSATSSETGAFTIEGIGPGDYTVIATSRTADSLRLFGSEEIHVSESNLDNVEVMLRPAATLRGGVLLDSGDAVPADLNRMLLALRRKQQGGFGSGTGGSVGSDRTFEFRHIAPGSYWLHVLRMPEGHYLQAALLGERDVLAEGILLRPSQTEERLRLLLSPRAARINGIVMDEAGSPAVGVTVLWIPDESRRKQAHLFGRVLTDQRGQFHISEIAPGTYLALALEGAVPGAEQDPETLRRYAGQLVEIGLSEDEQRELELTLTRGEVR